MSVLMYCVTLISIFGWATAAFAYGLHRLAWHMEAGGLTPEVTLANL